MNLPKRGPSNPAALVARLALALAACLAPFPAAASNPLLLTEVETPHVFQLPYSEIDRDVYQAKLAAAGVRAMDIIRPYGNPPDDDVTILRDRALRYEFDADGRVLRILEYYDHESNGRASRWAEFRYDAAGRLVSERNMAAGEGLYFRREYRYDAAGRLVDDFEYEDGRHLSTHLRLIHDGDRTLGFYPGEKGASIHYEIRGRGEVSDYRMNGSDGVQLVLSRRYDDAGRLVEEQLPRAIDEIPGRLLLAYRPDGRMTEKISEWYKTVGDGKGHSQCLPCVNRNTYDYDRAGNTIRDTSTRDGRVIDVREYHYDARGLIVAIGEGAERDEFRYYASEREGRAPRRTEAVRP